MRVLERAGGVELGVRAAEVRPLERADEARLGELAVGGRRAGFLAGGMADSSLEGMNERKASRRTRMLASAYRRADPRS